MTNPVYERDPCRGPTARERRRPMHGTLRVVIGVAILGALSAGCHGPRTAPSPVAAAPACPGPTLDVRDWTLVSDTAGLTYRLPESFVEHPDPRVAYRQWRTEGRSSGYVFIGINRSREHWITFRRAPSPGMDEMTECIDSVGGREILVQAWRMEGGIFRDGRRSDRYDVLTLVPIEPGFTAYVTGGGSDPEFQRIVLAISRTVRTLEP